MVIHRIRVLCMLKCRLLTGAGSYSNSLAALSTLLKMTHQYISDPFVYPSITQHGWHAGPHYMQPPYTMVT